uniref:Uncharacterized protein n=1 Tax=Romanomermis culicivorax TaxID=13658 RepID=A0A915J203_ROMCU
MHQYYNPENLNMWLQHCIDQAEQTGYGDYTGFKGTPYQRGGGLEYTINNQKSQVKFGDVIQPCDGLRFYCKSETSDAIK